MSKGPIITGIGNAASAKEAAALDADAPTRRWRCECGAMALGPICTNGHSAPWLSDGRAPAPEPEKVSGIVVKPRAPRADTTAVVNDSGIRVEKGVPLPPRGRYTQYPWAEMAIGDSFFIAFAGDRHATKKRASSIASAGRAWLRRNGVRNPQVAHRAVEGGIRIWRTA